MPPIIQNIFEEIPETLPREFFQILAEKNNVTIERIVSDGQATPEGEWYDQAWDEWVILIAGSAGLHFEGEAHSRILKPGDHVMIPASCRHRVEWTSPDIKTVWLAVHFGERRTDGTSR